MYIIKPPRVDRRYISIQNKKFPVVFDTGAAENMMGI
jgi:hypothetical protein